MPRTYIHNVSRSGGGGGRALASLLRKTLFGGLPGLCSERSWLCATSLMSVQSGRPRHAGTSKEMAASHLENENIKLTPDKSPAFIVATVVISEATLEVM